MILQLIQEKYSGKLLPKIIETYGGLEDHVVDVFGFKTPICAENSGKTNTIRSLNYIMSMSI